MDYSKYQYFLVEKKDKVALVTINRPEALNAVNGVLHINLEHLLVALGEDDEVRAIVLTGAGRAFCTGGDQKEPAAAVQPLEGPPLVTLGTAYRLIDNLVKLEKPIIAAVNGYAIGLGATIALFCDLVFAAESAKFADPHVKVGVAAGDGGSVIWPMLLGPARAKQYLLTGDMLDAREAERIGLINKVLPDDQLLPEALAFATRLANGATRAINATKVAVNLVMRQNVNLQLLASLATEFLSIGGEDNNEARRAFAEKRPPNFVGR